MNQNRNNNNNRRRGRGGNRGGQGGGNQGNRIDSRARGNAPQLLEKYRKLAHDASLNGDRVQTEYYLQFADHYFRVVADSRSQRDEQRPRREYDRDYDREGGFDENEDTGALEGDADVSRAPSRRRNRDEGDVRPDEGERAVEDSPVAAEAETNPFLRSRQPRGRRAQAADAPARETEAAAEQANESGFDAGILPPSIARDEPEPKPRATRGRPRKVKPADDSGGEALEAVN